MWPRVWGWSEIDGSNPSTSSAREGLSVAYVLLYIISTSLYLVKFTNLYIGACSYWALWKGKSFFSIMTAIGDHWRPGRLYIWSSLTSMYNDQATNKACNMCLTRCHVHWIDGVYNAWTGTRSFYRWYRQSIFFLGRQVLYLSETYPPVMVDDGYLERRRRQLHCLRYGEVSVECKVRRYSFNHPNNMASAWTTRCTVREKRIMYLEAHVQTASTLC